MNHLLFKQVWVRSLTSSNVGIQNCWEKHTAEKTPTTLARLENEWDIEVGMTQCHLQLLHDICVKAGRPLVIVSMNYNKKKRGFTDFPDAILLTGRDKYEVLPFLWSVSWPRNKTKFQLYLYSGSRFVCGDRPHWLSILDLFGLSESEATVPQTNRKRKMPWCTQLMTGEKFKIRSSLFNLLQPVEVDGHVFQQAGLLNELQHCILSAQPLLLSVHLWGMFQDVVAPPLCNYLNRRENKQVSNSSAIPRRGSCDQQQSSGWRWRRYILFPQDVSPCLPLPPWRISI